MSIAINKLNKFILDLNDNITIIEKAVVKTPTDPKTGAVDLQRLEPGDSAWITGTDSSSPLYGRPFLVTMTPNRQLALTGGGGIGSGGKRHLIMGGRSGVESKADREIYEKSKEVSEELGRIREEGVQAEKQARDTARELSKDVAKSLGIEHEPTREELRGQKSEIENLLYDDFIKKGLDEEQAQEYAKIASNVVVRQAQSQERRIAERKKLQTTQKLFKANQRLNKMQEEGATREEQEEFLQEVEDEINDSTQGSFVVDIPDFSPDLLKSDDFDETKMESHVGNVFEKAVDDYFDGIAGSEEDMPFEDEEGEPKPQVELATSVQRKVELNNPEALNDVVDKIRNLYDATDTVTHMRKLRSSLMRIGEEKASNVILNDMLEMVRATEAGELLDLEELTERSEVAYERFVTQNSSPVLYQIMTKYENEEISSLDRRDGISEASSLKFQVDGGASLALASISRTFLGSKMDTLRLIKDGSIELAAAATALAIRNKEDMNMDAYEEIMNQMKEYNVENTPKVEQIAIDRDKELSRQYDEVARQVEGGELSDEVRISSLQSDIITRQLSNIGNAVGSMRATATVLHYMEEFSKPDARPYVFINVGANPENVEGLLQRLKVKPGNYGLDDSDPNNIKIQLGIAGLNSLITKERVNSASFDRLSEIKEDMSNTTTDDMGHVLVANPNVPFFKERYVNEEGEYRDFNLRVEQRNAMNWLGAKTERTEDNPDGRGGGLINLETGGGKTLISAGFFANKIQENPNYKGLIIVPKGRGKQWEEEINKFTDLPVTVIPDTAGRETMENALTNVQPGSVVIMGHTSAARHSEMLREMQNAEDEGFRFDGVTIDEPQDLFTKGKTGGMGAPGRRLMRLPFKNRIALTATPLRDNVVDLHQLVTWAEGSSAPLGSRASFVRTWRQMGSSSNVQSQMSALALHETVDPYMYGSGISSKKFNTTRDTVNFSSTPEQVQEKRRIEQNAPTYINNFVQNRLEEIEADPNHSARYDRTGNPVRNWRQNAVRAATDEARRHVLEEHKLNMEGTVGDRPWQNNARISAVSQQLQDVQEGSKQVFYISSRYQREAMMSMLEDMGYNRRYIRNIASSTLRSTLTGQQMQERVRMFRENPDDNILFIDAASASGYNLQVADTIHFVGDPRTAVNYIQAEGRIAREPREGDITVKVYRDNTDLDEAASWDNLETALRINKAVTTGSVS